MTENLSTRGFTLRWLPPENATSEAVEYFLDQADNKEFSENLVRHTLSRKTEKAFEDLEPETSIHFRITAKPSRSYIQHLESQSSSISVTTLPVEPLELTGEVSALELGLESIKTKWIEPTNAGIQRIHYTLEVAVDKEFTEIENTYKEIQDLSLIHI